MPHTGLSGLGALLDLSHRIWPFDRVEVGKCVCRRLRSLLPALDARRASRFARMYMCIAPTDKEEETQ